VRRWITPHRAVRYLTEIRPSELAARGIRGVVLDLDNTLLPPTAPAPAAEVVAWVTALRACGLRAVVVSNAPKTRRDRIASQIGCPAIGGPPKPSLRRLRRALEHLGTAPAQTAAIGDQLFTDVLPANLLGLYTILVEPLDHREFVGTRLVRLVERLVGRGRITRVISEQESASTGRRTTQEGRRLR
jgi:HAD superfamily phosphatase (TIGR01668 family)